MASLVEELKLLELPAPSKFEVDDLAYDLTVAKVIGREDFEDDEVPKDTGTSSLRKKTDILLGELDKRYAGQKISRKELSKLRESLSEDEKETPKESISDYESASEIDNDAVGLAAVEKNITFQESVTSESGTEDSEHLENSIEESEINKENFEQNMEKREQEEEEARMQKFSTPDTDELQKGKAVVHQIGLWDSLLENRIRIQKSLVQINRLPQHDVFDDFEEQGGSQLKKPLNNSQQLLTNLLHNLMVLQQTLFERNTDTKEILDSEISSKKGHDESDEDIPSDFEDEGKDGEEGRREGADEERMDSKSKGEDESQDASRESLVLPKKRKETLEIGDYSANISKRHAAFERFRDGTIKKWNEKTRLASGKVNSKSFSSFDRSTLTQIKQILSDRERLIKRTQLKRSCYRVLGKMEDNEKKEMMEQRDAHLKDYDTEIFDDNDFYHQLLREFIERKSNVDPSDPVAMGRQWLEIQRLRNKVKRKVDTKASKGRRLRYDVHTKLVSFMAPQMKGTMQDSSRNELFSSLFGKRQPTETADIAIFR